MADRSSLKLSIAYDSEALMGFETGWGFSAILSAGGENVLFDCGWDGHVLRRNLGRMGYNLADISLVFLSHAHWDHMGGLPEVLQDAAMRESLKVVLHDGFSQRLRKEIGARATLVEVRGPEEIAPGIWSTGALGKEVKEHALFFSTTSGLVVLTGCAHPGIGPILECASSVDRVTSIIGGFHGAETSDFLTDIERIVPCHCTQRKDDILRAFASKASLGMVGAHYEFSR